MWSQIPSLKKVKEREIIREHLTHKQKLSQISSRIDNKSPSNRTHVKKNLKKRYIEQSNYNRINTYNQLLVKKLINVTTSHSPLNFYCTQRSLSKTRKTEENFRLSSENLRIQQKLKSSKTHYSRKKLKEDYRYASNISAMLSKNANRVPKIINYTQVEIDPNNAFLNKSCKIFQNSGR